MRNILYPSTFFVNKKCILTVHFQFRVCFTFLRYLWSANFWVFLCPSCPLFFLHLFLRPSDLPGKVFDTLPLPGLTFVYLFFVKKKCIMTVQFRVCFTFLRFLWSANFWVFLCPSCAFFFSLFFLKGIFFMPPLCAFFLCVCVPFFLKKGLFLALFFFYPS